MKETIYPTASMSTKDGIINFIPASKGSLSRLGYKNFIGLIWHLAKANRGCQKTQCKVTFNFTLPVSWL